MKGSKFIKLALALIIILLAIIAYRLLGTVVKPKIESKVAQISLTANEVAANGPLPGDVGLYAKELACQQKIPTPGYYASINGAEISDSERSGLFPCASFTGSVNGPNQLFAWRSADDYPGLRLLI